MREYGYDAHQGMTSASDLGGENEWQYTYGLTKVAQIVWDAESGDVRAVPVDARASAYEFTEHAPDVYGDLQGAEVHGAFTSELRTVTTPRGDTTTFERDSSGRPSVVRLPWGATKTYTYTDNDALPESVKLPQGTTLSFTHDGAKREVERTSSIGESRSFVYGPGDRIERMTDATGTTTYEYDVAGRFAGIVYPHGGSVRYQRDKLGRTIRQEVRATATSEPVVTQYAYDEVGNLSVVLDPLGGETAFEYDAENRLVRRELPNGVVTAYTYDLRDRPLSVVHTNASGVVLASRTYVRAPGGEPTRITKQDGSYVEVGYDSALRITSERYFDEAGELEEEIAYAYDADGNRTSKTVDGVVSSYAYTTGSRLTGVTTGGVTQARVTDNGGRETQLVVGGSTATLTYDSDDHVTRVVKNGQTTTYGFDAMGRRTKVVDAAGEKRYLVAPNMGGGFNSPQAITDGGGTVVANFVFAGGLPLMKVTSSGPVYYLADGMGTVLGTADAGGVGLASFDYDAFGNERGAGAGLPYDTYGEFRFQGMWKDPSGLYYVRARMYDAATGRFTSRDAARGFAKAPESYYPYAFANGNPLRYGDPSGRYSLNETQVAVAIAGGLASLASESFAIFRDATKRNVTTWEAASRAVSAFAGGAISSYISLRYDAGGFVKNLAVDAVAGGISSIVTQLGKNGFDGFSLERLGRDAAFNAMWQGFFRQITGPFRESIHGHQVAVLDAQEEAAESLAVETVDEASRLIENSMSHFPEWHATEAQVRAVHGFVLGYLKKVVQPMAEEFYDGLQKKQRQP